MLLLLDGIFIVMCNRCSGIVSPAADQNNSNIYSENRICKKTGKVYCKTQKHKGNVRWLWLGSWRYSQKACSLF